MGAALSLQGASYLREPYSASITWLAGLAAFLAGSLLIIGLLTPVAASVALLVGVGIVFSVLPISTPTAFDSKLTLVFAATMLLNSLFLGPGAYSVDAKLFGRREIIIPTPLR